MRIIFLLVLSDIFLISCNQNLIFQEDFSTYENAKLSDIWWVEGGEEVTIDEGHLRIKANAQDSEKIKKGGNVCTVWLNKVFNDSDIAVEFDAQVIGSRIPNSNLAPNNINFFFLFSDPKGIPLKDTMKARSDGKYTYYHSMNGYIFTYLNDVYGKGGLYGDGSTKARSRMRKCSPNKPFKLLVETYDHHCKSGVTYHFRIEIKHGYLSFYVDGKKTMEAKDEAPHKRGLIGFRTYQTDLWFDNIKVIKL
jgi:hypothetical protein